MSSSVRCRYWIREPEFKEGIRILRGAPKSGATNWMVYNSSKCMPVDHGVNLVTVIFKHSLTDTDSENDKVLPGLAFDTLAEAKKELRLTGTLALRKWRSFNINGRKVLLYVDLFQVIKSNSHRLSWKRGFYKASRTALENAKQNAMFTWLCLQSYMTSPLINSILFRVNGDWTAFDQRFGNVIETHARVAKYADPDDPYNIFNTFFKAMLLESAQVKKYLYDRSGRHKILDEASLRKYYPEVIPFLDMRDKAVFTLSYVAAIQNIIMSIPRLINTVDTFRGYVPLGIPDTLTLNVDDLRVGQKIVTWGFMSVSLNSQIAADFIDKRSKGSCCMLRVVIPSNEIAFLIQSASGDRRFPRNLAPFHGEEEILLPAGTVVKVLSLKGYKSYKNSQSELVTVKTAKVVIVGVKKPKLPKAKSPQIYEDPISKMKSYLEKYLQ
jgi:hypothetical protein